MIRTLLFFCALLCASQLSAQDRRPSHCIAIANSTPGLSYLHKASYRDPLPDYTV